MVRARAISTICGQMSIRDARERQGR